MNIWNAEIGRLAAELAERTGETKTEAVIRALQERPDRLGANESHHRQVDSLLAIVEEFDRLPVRDSRPPDEIFGYDENGLPS